MGFFITMFFCNLLIPVIMMIGGYWMVKHPPKEINSLLGYRTSMSKKNKDTWNFAHNFCGRLWIKLGILVFVVSICIQIPFMHASDDGIGNMTLFIEFGQLAILLLSIIVVEKKLKQTFDENGRRK